MEFTHDRVIIDNGRGRCRRNMTTRLKVIENDSVIAFQSQLGFFLLTAGKTNQRFESPSRR